VDAERFLQNTFSNETWVGRDHDDGKKWIQGKIDELLNDYDSDLDDHDDSDAKRKAISWIRRLNDSDDFNTNWVFMLFDGDFNSHKKALKAAKEYIKKYDDDMLSYDDREGKNYILKRINKALKNSIRRLYSGDDQDLAADWIKSINDSNVENQWALMAVYGNDEYLTKKQLKRTKKYVQELGRNIISNNSDDVHANLWLEKRLKKQIKAKSDDSDDDYYRRNLLSSRK